MTIGDMVQAVQAANAELQRADSLADDLARLLVGRLRHVSPFVLARLKAELRDFNMQTKRWMR